MARSPDYHRDGITLYLGDCLEILPELAGVDVIVSDPPYGIAWKRGVNNARNSKPHKGIIGDDDTSARDSVLDLMPSVPAIMFGSFYAPFPKNLKQVLVWHKPPDSGLVGSVTGYRRDAEPIFLIGKWPVRTVEASSVIHTATGQAATVSATGHQHTKPVHLMEQLIRRCPGEVICDPFCGSGSTGQVATSLGQFYIGCELNPEYAEMSRARIDFRKPEKKRRVVKSKPKPAPETSRYLPAQKSLFPSDVG